MRLKLPVLLILLLSTTVVLIQETQWQNDRSQALSIEIDQQQTSWQFHNSQEWRYLTKPPYRQTYSQNQRIEHHNESKKTIFFQPFIVQKQDQKLTTLEANNGRSNETESKNIRVILTGNAVINEYHLEPSFAKQRKISSHELIYNTTPQTLQSSKKVVITQPELSLEGVGLNANLNTEEFTLNQHFKTLYSPQTTP